MEQAKNCFDRKLVIFDLDGCLVDTAGEIALVANTVRERMGFTPLPQEYVKGCIGGGLRKILALCLPEVPERIDEAVEMAKPVYAEISGSIAQPYPGVVDALKALHGKRKIALATNKIRPATVKLFDKLDITQYFDFLVCAGDVPNVKPDPACVNLALEHFGLKAEEAIMVGDTPVDVKTARNAGMDTIAVTYGMAKPEDVLASEPFAAVDSMEKVLEMLLPVEER